jgi:WD40 repeat protein
VANNAALVAAGTADGRLWLWKGDEGKSLGQPDAHKGGVTGVALASAGNQLLTAGADGAVKVWDPAKPDRAKATWPAHPAGAVHVAYLPNGRALTAGADGALKLWDVGAGKELKKFSPLIGPATALSVSRDGALVAAAAGQTVKVWAAGAGGPAGTVAHPAAVTALAFSPDKARLLTGAADGLARIWELASGRLLLAYPHGGAVRGVAWHPGTPAVVSVAADRSGAIQAVPVTRALVASAKPVRTLALSPDGNQLLVGGEESAVKVFNTGSGAEERVYPGAGGPVTAVAVAKNGQLVAVASADRKVRLFAPGEAPALAELATAAEVRGLAFHPNNTGLATGDAGGAVTLWNTQYQPGQPPPTEFSKPVQSFAHGAAVAGLAFATDGKALYSAGQDKAVKAWKLTADGPVANLAHPNLVDAIAYSPDGKLLATACHDGQLRLWDAAKNQAVRAVMASAPPQPGQQVEPLYCVAWSPDNKLIATGGNDRAVRVWNAADGKPVKEFKGYDEKANPKGHREGVFCLLFTPDGKHVVSGSSDRSIKLWSLDTGALVREFVNPAFKADYPVAHPGWVHGLRLLDGGKLLVSVGAAPRLHGSLAVWNLADGKLRRRFFAAPGYQPVPTHAAAR